MLKTQTSVSMPPAETTTPPTHRSWLASKRNWLWVIPVLLMVTWLAAQQLEGAFWVDEVISEDRAGAPLYGPRSPAAIWEHTAQTTYDQVPGYYILLALWGNFLGWSEFSARLLSLMVGLLGIAWTYRLGREMHSPLAGLGAAVALGASALFIVFLHEARTYALLVLLGAMTIWLYWRVITRPTGRLTQAALVLAAAAMLYAHYFAALLVFSICLYHLLFRPKNREWWRVVVLMGLAGALFLPWFLTQFDVVDGANSQPWRQAMGMTIPEITDELLGFFGNGSLALLLVVGIFAAQVRRQSTTLIWFLLLTPIVIALAVNAWIGMLVSPKFLLYLWVPMSLLFGVGVAALAHKGVQPAFLLLPWLVIGVWNTVNWQEDPIKYVEWNVLHEQLAGQTTTEDAVVFHLHATKWDGDHQRAMTHYFSDFPEKPILLWSWPEASDDPYLEGANRAADGAARLWSSYDPRYVHQRLAKFDSEIIQRGFASCGRYATDPVMAVDLFASPPENAMPYQFGADRYDDGIRMTMLGELQATADGRLRLPIGWQMGTDVPVNTYSFALHLFDQNGAVVAQRDIGLPPRHEFGCQIVDFDVLPPGDYNLTLTVYAWETGDKLTADNHLDNSSDDHVVLGQFNVNP